MCTEFRYVVVEPTVLFRRIKRHHNDLMRIQYNAHVFIHLRIYEGVVFIL